MPKPSEKTTKPTQIRLTDLDKALIQDIREWEELPSIAEAVRHSLRLAHLEARKKNLRNSKREA